MLAHRPERRALEGSLPLVGVAAGLLFTLGVGPRWLTGLVFVPAICIVWSRVIVDWWGSWKAGGVERHVQERAGLITLLLAIPAFMLYGLASWIWHLPNPDGSLVASILIVGYIVAALVLQSQLISE